MILFQLQHPSRKTKANDEGATKEKIGATLKENVNKNAEPSAELEKTSVASDPDPRRVTFEEDPPPDRLKSQPKPDVEEDATEEAGFNNFKGSKPEVWYCLLAILLYIAFGTVTFGLWREDLNYADAMYFTVVTFTTCGYGDIYPESPAERAFGIVFVLFGIIVLGGIALGVLFDGLFDAFENAKGAANEATKTHLMDKLSHTSQRHLNVDSADSTKSDKTEEVEEEEEEEENKLKSKLVEYTILLIVLISPSALIGYFEGWTFLDSLYFCIISATTVGYGDVTPQSTAMRLVAVFYLPICVGIGAKFLGDTTQYYFKRKADEADKEFLNRKLTPADIEAMDISGDGQVDLAEFLVFMLLAMEKVDHGTIKELEKIFIQLDVSGDGSLDFDDLVGLMYGDDDKNDSETTDEFV